MKKIVLASLLVASVPAMAAVNEPTPAAPAVNETNVTISNQVPNGTVFTNQTGQNYSVAQLAEQLKTLRSVVEQTLPLLQSFNTAASSSATGNQSLSGKLSGILSDALNRGGQTNSGALNNAVSSLRSLLNTNASSSAGTTDARAAQQLITLQKELQPVLTSLQELNVQGTAAVPNQPSTSQPGQSPGTLTPTGKY